MKHKLACRLAVTYGFLFILAIAVVDIALVSVYRASQLKKNEDYYINLSSILSSMAENNIRITNYITHGEGLADRRNGRVLLVDISGRVLLDSGGELSGTHLTNPEFRKTSQYGEPAAGYYTYDKKGMAMFSYPVSLSGRIGAVVLVSVYIQDIYDDVNRFAFRISTISIMVAIVVVAVSILMGRHLSDPITVLTDAVDKIYKGSMESAVEIKRNDEIGILAGAFNRMGSELQRIETGRKRFISDVSHELKTPLASIKALVEALLAEDTDSAECREYLQDINHEIDRLNGLVVSLLTSARLEEMTLKKESLCLADEVERTIRALQPLAIQKRISLYNNCSRDVVIYADKNMLREVLINLVDNSIKYGVDDGFVKIDCSYDSLRVTDNGPGIPEEEIDNIFDCFYRVDRSRSGESGNGIGLFVVKRIIEMHGFRISVSGRAGEGCIFTVEFGKSGAQGKLPNL
jgi:two-component system OmpR family sensor kinase